MEIINTTNRIVLGIVTVKMSIIFITIMMSILILIDNFINDCVICLYYFLAFLS